MYVYLSLSIYIYIYIYMYKVLVAGDSFGEGIILGQEENYNYTVTAITPMQISYIPEAPLCLEKPQ